MTWALKSESFIKKFSVFQIEVGWRIKRDRYLVATSLNYQSLQRDQLSHSLVKICLSTKVCLFLLFTCFVWESFFVWLSLGLCCNAFAKSLAALDGFGLYTVHNLSSNEMAETGFGPGAAGCKARELTIVLCGPPSCENLLSTSLMG